MHISIRDRLIFALDVPSLKEAKKIVKELGESVNFYKLGLELLMSGEYFNLIKWLKENDKKIFADLKFFDVPETISRTIKQIKEYKVDFVTIHGQDAKIAAAASKNKNEVKILAVTVLTSISESDIQLEYSNRITILDLIEHRAKESLNSGCDGIICSGKDIAYLRNKIGNNFIAVCPAIRPQNTVVSNDDQKRFCTPTEAFKNGADYIVVGRPIRDAKDRKAKAEEIQKEIQVVLD